MRVCSRSGHAALRGLMKAVPPSFRLASRFSLRVRFGAFFAFPPRDALSAMSFTLPFVSWRDSDDHSPFLDEKHFLGKRASTCLFLEPGYGEGMFMTVLRHPSGRPSDAALEVSAIEVASSGHEVLPPRKIGVGVDVLLRPTRRAPPP